MGSFGPRREPTDRVGPCHEAFTPLNDPGPVGPAADAGFGVRLPEVLVALSLATDLGLGRPAVDPDADRDESRS